MLISHVQRITVFCTVVALSIISGAGSRALAQSRFMPTGGASQMLSSMPLLGNFFNADFPGVADSRAAMVFPPMFRGEARGRAIYLFSQKQSFNNTALGISADLHRDLDFNDEGAMLEVMARVQAGRYSVRAHYDEWLVTFRSANGHLNWPVFRMGLDLDLYYNSAFRIGLNCDVNWEEPILSLVAVPGQGALQIEWDRPATLGLHAAYNPFGFGGLAISCETRMRWPVTPNSRVTEFEIAGGVKGPATLVGAWALRGGWRYTAIELRKNNSSELSMKWSGIFGGLVYFY
jgi:hypothetical protein